MRYPAALLLVTCVASSSLIARQNPSPTFEVASIKRSTSDLPGPRWGGSPGRWQMINGPTASLIWTAYETPVFELPGAPAWVHSDRYDVVATHDAGGLTELDIKLAAAMDKLME